MPGAFEFDTVVLSAAPATMDTLPAPVKADDDDEIVLDVSNGAVIHDAPEFFSFPSKGPFREPEPEEPSPIPGMYIPTPLNAANTAPMWLLAAANDNAGIGMTSIGAQLAAANGKGIGGGATGKAADPWSIFSPPPAAARPLPRPRHRVNTTKFRAFPSIQQALPDSKVSAPSSVEKDAANAM
ncbi:hypothetical protein SCHPADRAFT_899329 [Schizopora paradoxa]|uniref:Uncharacterized protein n=1 Tax=Schizopora paradoxa TaxID=27342 RepID=A0A0H2S501_9AGAM|nr:hypothetical protein SCHPADRAFT_899329 [Schizopora paradoxa]